MCITDLCTRKISNFMFCCEKKRKLNEIVFVREARKTHELRLVRMICKRAFSKGQKIEITWQVESIKQFNVACTCNSRSF